MVERDVGSDKPVIVAYLAVHVSQINETTLVLYVPIQRLPTRRDGTIFI